MPRSRPPQARTLPRAASSKPQSSPLPLSCPCTTSHVEQQRARQHACVLCTSPDGSGTTSATPRTSVIHCHNVASRPLHEPVPRASSSWRHRNAVVCPAQRRRLRGRLPAAATAAASPPLHAQRGRTSACMYRSPHSAALVGGVASAPQLVAPEAPHRHAPRPQTKARGDRQLRHDAAASLEVVTQYSYA